MTCAGCSSDPGLVLALNGADERLQAALGRQDKDGMHLLAAQEWTVPGQAVRFLAPGIRHMLDALGLAAQDIRRIACVVGPGSFTGLRMSLALAQGLAAASGAQLAGLGHLDLLAFEAAQMTMTQGSVLALAWSRRDQVYAQAFQGTGEAVIPLTQPEALALSALSALLTRLPRPVHLLGGGLRKNLDFFTELAAQTPDLRLLPNAWDAPRPAVLLQLASCAAFGHGALAPVYLRASDAEENLAAIAAGRGLAEGDARAILERGSRTLE